MDNGLILKSPIRKEDRPSEEAPEAVEALSREQAKALLDAVKGLRVYTFCLIALTTGLRRGEILGLMWEDVDLDAGILTVRHNKSFLPNQNDAPVTTMLKTEAAQEKYRELHDEEYQSVMEAAMKSSKYKSASPKKRAELLEVARDDVAPQVKNEFLKWLKKNYKATPNE